MKRWRRREKNRTSIGRGAGLIRICPNFMYKVSKLKL
jgi:hypothetical protein